MIRVLSERPVNVDGTMHVTAVVFMKGQVKGSIRWEKRAGCGCEAVTVTTMHGDEVVLALETCGVCLGPSIETPNFQNYSLF